MKEFFADFHCHPTLRALNTPATGGERNMWDKTFNANTYSPVGRWARMQSREIAKESQANFYAYAENNIRLVFDSLYPVEKGWFNFRKMPGYIVGDKAREEIMLVAMGIEKKRLSYLKSIQSYFTELKECYEFLLNNQGASPCGKYKYKLVSDYTELENILNNQPNTIAVVVNIEGAHALEAGSPESRNFSLKDHKNILSENIAEIKSWDFPPFSINLAHHFWNQLCGHSRSLKSPLHLVFNQEKGINTGINYAGWHVLEELLSRKNGRRIFIDSKHMSVQARKEYFQFVARHNNMYPADKIPIICSHTGVNGYKSMDDSVLQKDNRRKFNKSYFNNWSLNISEEEINIICKSGGMIGLMLDKSLLGGPEMLKHIAGIKDPLKRKISFLKLLLDNVFTIVRAVGNKSGWEIITIGSDFDGLITHIDGYENATRMPQLKKDLIEYLNVTGYMEEHWYDYSPELLMHKIFSGNLMEFMKVNFRHPDHRLKIA